MIEILDKLIEARNDNGFESSIKAIWDMGYRFLEEDSTRGNDPKKLTIKICKELTESVAVTKAYLNVLENLYYDSILAYNTDKKDIFHKKSKLIYDLIDDRDLTDNNIVRRYINKDDSIYITQAKDNRFIIDKEGLLRKNIVHFDNWYEKDKKSIVDFYSNSIEEIFNKSDGCLVFVDKEFGSKGPYIIKEIIEKKHRDFDIIVIKNGQVRYKNRIENKHYCIIDDVIADDYKNIIKYQSLIKETYPSLKFNSSIVLYNGSQYFSKGNAQKSMSLIDFFRSKDILSEYNSKSSKSIDEGSVLETLVFGIGSVLGLGNAKVGLFFRDYTNDVIKKIKNLNRYQLDK